MSNGNLVGQTSDPNLSGVFGKNTGQGGVGVAGVSDTGDGVRAVSTSGNGLSAFSNSSTAVFARAKTQPGVSGISDSNDGVRAVSTSGNGLSAFSGNSVGVFAQGATWAGVFNGRLAVSPSPTPKDPSPNPPRDGSIVITDGDLFLNKGDIFLFLGNAADCAEDFAVADDTEAEPGTVMVLDEDGRLRRSSAIYDTRVAGVISGAGCYKSGLVLDRRPNEPQRAPLALIGKVYCKVDASYGAVKVGDMLTTSPTVGYAMKAKDTARSFGSIIGKALQPLSSGTGLIRILVALQ